MKKARNPGQRNPSLIVRLLWSLCLMQAVVFVLSLVGMLYHLADDRLVFIEKAVLDTLLQATVVGPEGLSLRPGDDLDRLRAANPDLWAVIADEHGRQLRLGTTPAVYEALAANLASLGASEIHPLAKRAELALRIDMQTVQGERIHGMAGGAAGFNLNRVILLIVGIFSPYFVVPLLLFTLIATPIVVLHATRGVRRLAREAAALDLSDREAQLSEESIPREIRPLVSAFNDAMARLRDAYYARDRFLRDAAHELRMPIAILMARIEGMPPHPIKPVLLTDLSRLANVAEQLLDLQRLQDPGTELAPVDLVELSREVVSDLAPLALLGGNELVLDAPGHGVWVRGQATALGRVVVNLLQNAMVHGGSPGVVSLGVGADGTLAVADQGGGVPAEDRERIFQPFYRGTATTPGHGLGLHLAQEIVRRHGGRITVASGPEGGAVFTVHLVRIAGPEH